MESWDYKGPQGNLEGYGCVPCLDNLISPMYICKCHQIHTLCIVFLYINYISKLWFINVSELSKIEKKMLSFITENLVVKKHHEIWKIFRCKPQGKCERECERWPLLLFQF